jgi:hypothetical protein
VARIAADLRAKMLTPGPERQAALSLHGDERVGEGFDVWTDLLSRRAAVLWVLKSVYVRVLEDRGLLAPGRLLDPETQHLFEHLAPHLGETAFLRWVYRDLASGDGGLPELFGTQPAEVALPSDDLSRALITFWRHKDADTGAQWSFASERFEGELMGDLYQELDPVVKARYALCQTPDFVRAFMLDRTLTPAIETFGADQVRLLDPCCGSGHILIDGLKRLFAATQLQHSDWTELQVARHVLDRVVGIDINDYACGLARTRLVMTAAELAGVRTLADAGQFHPHIYWADGLEQVEREDTQAPVPLPFLDGTEEKPRAMFTRTDVRVALKKVFEKKFHAVVANPPYIIERDEARKVYHREPIGSNRRYVSATGKYSLASPFTERCFQLATKDGFVGIITSNNFMKREFGKALIEKVLAGVDLSLVVDTSHAYIPFHDTPTAMLFGRNRLPTSQLVRTVMGKRGESGIPEFPAKGLVWSSIETGWQQSGFENEFVSVTDLSRKTLDKHPWSLGGGGASELKAAIDASASSRLGDIVVDIGPVSFPGVDDVFLMPEGAMRRLQIPERFIKPFCPGDAFRDWAYLVGAYAIAPYDDDFNPVLLAELQSGQSYFWRYRSTVKANIGFGGKTRGESGEPHWTWYRWIPDRFRNPLSIVFSFVASHNHFVLDRGGKVFNRSSPVIKLPPGATEEEHFALLGILNSSIACFWMKQVFYPKGSATHDVSKDGLQPENNGYEFAATGMQSFPLPNKWLDNKVIEISRALDHLAIERQSLTPSTIISIKENLDSAQHLSDALATANNLDQKILARMVFWQEELDWQCYRLYGIVDSDLVRGCAEFGIAADARPFSVTADPNWCDLPSEQANLYNKRWVAISTDPNLRLIETPVNKRLWRGRQGIFGRYDRTVVEKTTTALKIWLVDRVEAEARARTKAFNLESLVAALQDDPQVLTVCEVLTGRRDFSP